MPVPFEQSEAAYQILTRQFLHELNIPVHRVGYRHLCIAIPRYAQDVSQSLTKDIYPYVASRYRDSEWNSVERAVRSVIRDAWERRDAAVWDRYFPNCRRVPSNKLFISMLAEYVSKTPIPELEGALSSRGYAVGVYSPARETSNFLRI